MWVGALALAAASCAMERFERYATMPDGRPVHTVSCVDSCQQCNHLLHDKCGGTFDIAKYRTWARPRIVQDATPFGATQPGHFWEPLYGPPIVHQEVIAICGVPQRYEQAVMVNRIGFAEPLDPTGRQNVCELGGSQ